MTRWGPVALQASFVYAALAAAMSRVNLAHNSDTVLQALISVIHWTPYYWAENRFGMLVPLIAAPITDPGANLIFQMVLIAWSGIFAIWLVMRLTEDPPEAALAAALVLCGVLVLFKPTAALLMLLQSTYITPVSLLLGGWLVYTRTKLGLAVRLTVLAVALLLSFWINVANVVFAVAVAALWPGFSVRERAWTVGLIAAANVAATAIASLVPGQSFRELLPPSEWLPALLRLLSSASANMIHLPVMLVLLAVGAASLAIRRRWDVRAAIGIAACAQIAVVALSEWVSRNGSDARYITPPLFVLGVLAIGVVAIPVARKLHSPAMSFGLASLIVVAPATKAFGFPSPSQARSYLVEATRPAAESFGDGPCTHLIGDYWRVWMAAYHDMLTRPAPRKPVTYRSEMIRPYWDREPQKQRIYCAACSDGTVEFFRIQQGVPPLAMSSDDGAACRWTAP